MRLREEEVVVQVRGANVRRLRTWIERGWIAPAAGSEGPVYSEIDVARVDLICQLRDEFEVERESVPVVLALLDQVYGLRRELRSVMRAIEAQPEEVRKEILALLAKAREE